MSRLEPYSPYPATTGAPKLTAHLLGRGTSVCVKNAYVEPTVGGGSGGGISLPGHTPVITPPGGVAAGGGGAGADSGGAGIGGTPALELNPGHSATNHVWWTQGAGFGPLTNATFTYYAHDGTTLMHSLYEEGGNTSYLLQNAWTASHWSNMSDGWISENITARGGHHVAYGSVAIVITFASPTWVSGFRQTPHTLFTMASPIDGYDILSEGHQPVKVYEGARMFHVDTTPVNPPTLVANPNAPATLFAGKEAEFDPVLTSEIRIRLWSSDYSNAYVQSFAMQLKLYPG